MNMMVLSADHRVSARALADRHVHKIGLECLQVFCTAARETRLSFDTHPIFAPFLPLPKSTHEGHPLVAWALEDRANLAALAAYASACFAEYRERFHKEHRLDGLAEAALEWVWGPDSVRGSPSNWCPCVPEDFRGGRVAEYRAPLEQTVAWYQDYLRAKYRGWGDQARWSNRLPPAWLEGKPTRAVAHTKDDIGMRMIYTVTHPENAVGSL